MTHTREGRSPGIKIKNYLDLSRQWDVYGMSSHIWNVADKEDYFYGAPT